MSEALIASVPPKAALWVLSEIDNQCDIAAGCDVQIVRGPFGAFSHRQERATTTAPDDTSIEVGDVTVTEDSYNSLDDPFSDGSDETSPPVDLVRQDHGGYSLERSLSPWTQSLVQQILEQSEQISIPPSPDLRNMSFDSGRIQEILPGGINMQDFAMPPAMQGFQFAPLNTPYPFNQSLSTPAANGMTRAAGVVPQDAVLLLNHYATVVVNSLTPFRHSKTPWHVLFLPHAKNCLAALTLGETMDHASMSAFYGTLSISAYSLGGVSDAQMWLEAGKAYKNQAREQTKLMLRTAYDVPKTSKYKTILMALITMVQVSLFSGSRDQTECYLLETEKFIRLRGLNRKKSRKVRLLHHCYAFERIFHESMFICGANSKQRRHVRDAIQSSGLVVYGQDVPVFRINGWTNLFREMMAVKSQEDGENDLHIERPGLFVTTLYPEIYGVPEPWMFLLSQVIRLGNEKESSEQDDAGETTQSERVCCPSQGHREMHQSAATPNADYRPLRESPTTDRPPCTRKHAQGYAACAVYLFLPEDIRCRLINITVKSLKCSRLSISLPRLLILSSCMAPLDSCGLRSSLLVKLKMRKSKSLSQIGSGIALNEVACRPSRTLWKVSIESGKRDEVAMVRA